MNKDHEIFVEKLKLVNEMMPLLRQDHFNYLLARIKDTSFQNKIFELISSGNSKIRLKGLSITKIIFESFC